MHIIVHDIHMHFVLIIVLKLTQAVREDKENTVKEWIEYIKGMHAKGGHGMHHGIHLHHSHHHENLENIPMIDQVDDYDPHYNAVHNAVITNNVKLLNMLSEAGAG